MSGRLAVVALATSAAALTVPLIRVNPGRCRLRDGALVTGPSVPITNDLNLALMSVFDVGSPGQPTLLQLDTGSTIVWTANASVARQQQDPEHHGYDASASSTARAEGYTTDLSYGSGSLSVAAMRDVLAWSPGAGVSLSASAQFGVTVNGGGWVANGWNGFVNDGILGLAMQGLCQWRSCKPLAWQALWGSGGFGKAFSLLATSKTNSIPPVGKAAAAAASLPCDGVVVAAPVDIREATRPGAVPAGRLAALAGMAPADARAAGATADELEAAARVPGRLMASSPAQSSLTFGGLNASHAAAGASLYTIPLSTTDEGTYGYYWAPLMALTVTSAASGSGAADDDAPPRPGSSSTRVFCPATGGVPMQGCQALFDSGTSLLALRSDVAEEVVAGVNAAASGTCSSFEGSVTCPADQVDFSRLPNLTFAFAVAKVTALPDSGFVSPPSVAAGSPATTFTFALSGAALMDCETIEGSCRVMVMEVPSDGGSLAFILGDTFLRSWVALFDAEGAAVSLARSVAGPEPEGQPSQPDPLLIALVVVGSIVGAAVLAGVGWILYQRWRQRRLDRARATLEDMDSGGGAASATMVASYVAMDA